jgi:hypothetical protein
MNVYLIIVFLKSINLFLFIKAIVPKLLIMNLECILFKLIIIIKIVDENIMLTGHIKYTYILVFP